MSLTPLEIVTLDSGEGISPALHQLMTECLRDVASRYGAEVSLTQLPIGQLGIKEYGHPLHPKVIEAVRRAPLVLKTPCGIPDRKRYAEEYCLPLGSVDRALRSENGCDTPTQVAWVKGFHSYSAEYREVSFAVMFDDHSALTEWESPDGDQIMTQAVTSLSQAVPFVRRCVRLMRVRARSDKRKVSVFVPVQVDRRPRHDRLLLCCLEKEGVEDLISVKECKWGSLHAKLDRTLGEFDFIMTDPSRAETIFTLGASKVGPIGQQAVLWLGDRTIVAQPFHGPAASIENREQINPVGAVWSVALGLKMLPVLSNLEIPPEQGRRLTYAALLLHAALNATFVSGAISFNAGGKTSFSDWCSALRYSIDDQYVDYDASNPDDLAAPPAF